MRRRRLALSAILVVGVVLSGCAAKKMAKEAESLLVDGRTTRAARMYERVCEKRPTKAAFQLGWARALLADGEADRAVVPARAALLAEEEGAKLVLIDALLRTGALSEARELLASSPEHPDYLELEAWALLVGGDSAAAVAAMEHVVKVETTAARQARLAWFYVRAGEVSRAVGAAKLALTEDESEVDTLGDVVATLLVAGREEERRDVAREIQSFGPEVLERWKEQAGRAQQAGDMEGALRSMTRTVALKPDDGELQGLLGTMFMAVGDHALAIRFLEAALHTETFRNSWERAEGFNEAGAVHTMGFENDQAAAFGHALAKAHQATGNTLVAARTLRSALLVGGDDEPERWLEAALLFYEGGNLTGAGHAAHYAQKVAPRHPGALVMLTKLYLAIGDTGQAIGYGRMAWSASPGDPHVALILGKLYERRGDAGGAREIYLQALERHPEVIELRAAVKRLER